MGNIGSQLAPIPGVNGDELGGAIGGLLPFKTGGKIPGAKGRPRVVMCHGGEFVLPANCKPTKAQKAIVAKNKKRLRVK